MKSFKIIAAVALVTLGAGALRAQTPEAGDLLMLSQQNLSFSTARVSAMGGAFTSLGADLASMSINPAGLGMYRGSDFGFSPVVSISDMSTNYGGLSSSQSKTQFSVGNLGAAFNVYQSTGALTSFTLGIGYNRLADFNTTSYAGRNGIGNSYLEVLAERVYGMSPSSLSGLESQYKPFYNLPIYQWGSILAYQAWAIEPVEGSDPQRYTPLGPPAGTGPLSVDATMNPRSWIYTKGCVGEYAFSGGMNFSNKFYLGFTIGLQDYYYNSENVYHETYNNNTANLNSLQYNRQQRFSGTGYNFKLGAIYRPVDNLRIGVAIHTPTWVHMEEHYREYMAAGYSSTGTIEAYDSPLAANTYNIVTPTRLLTGLSYTWPGVGLISIDYERAWYNGMRLKNTGFVMEAEKPVKQDIKNYFQASNSFRAGLELTPTEQFFVRAGYAYYGSSIKQDDYLAYANGNDVVYYNFTHNYDEDEEYPISVTPKHASITSYYNISGGLGYRFESFYVDATYVYSKYNYQSSPLFFFEELKTGHVIESGDIDYSQKRHTIILTVGVKF